MCHKRAGKRLIWSLGFCSVLCWAEGPPRGGLRMSEEGAGVSPKKGGVDGCDNIHGLQGQLESPLEKLPNGDFPLEPRRQIPQHSLWSRRRDT